MTIIICLATALSVIGLCLILWARFNPRWQSAEAYDALAPFIGGAVLFVFGAILWLIVFVAWFRSHWHA